MGEEEAVEIGKFQRPVAARMSVTRGLGKVSLPRQVLARKRATGAHPDGVAPRSQLLRDAANAQLRARPLHWRDQAIFPEQNRAGVNGPVRLTLAGNEHRFAGLNIRCA
jgi:hypothetical protein